MRVLPLLAAVLLAAGCAGEDDDSSSTTTAVAAGTGCTPATTELMTPLQNRLTLGGARLVNGQIARSSERDGVYFVAAEIDAPELQTSGDVAVWATTSRHGGEPIYAVNELAKRYSDWRAAAALDVTSDDGGAENARRCVFR
jgi:hypothetical protein